MTEPQTYKTPDGEQHVVDEHVCEAGWVGEDLDDRAEAVPGLPWTSALASRRELGLSGLGGAHAMNGHVEVSLRSP
jgi:hypothetical protein